MTHRRTDAIGAGIAAADDDHVLVFGRDVVAVLMLRVEQALGVGVQKLHRHVNTLEIAALNRQIARLGRAAADHDGVVLVFASRSRKSLPTVGVGDERDAFGAIRSTRRCTIFLSSFMFGMPYMSKPPMRSARSKTVTRWPALIELRRAGQARRAGTDHGDFLAGARRRRLGGRSNPRRKPLSIMAHSMFLIVTGGLLIPSTQEPSHGAGQTRPVNSGNCWSCAAGRALRATDRDKPDRSILESDC